MFNLFSIIVVGLVLFISLLLKFLEYVEIITVPNLAQKLLKTTIKIASVYLVIATLIIVFWPKNNRQIRKIISNQVKVETEKAKEALTVLEKKSKNGLSLDEIRKAKNLKKQIEETEEYYKSGGFEEKKATSKPAPAPVYKWIFGFKAEPEDIINAKGKDVDQICYRENDVVNKPYFDKNEIRFKYKTSKNKVVYAILDKKSPSETHFLGMVDLPDQTGKPKGRKLIIRLKETSMPDKFEGLIETWDGKNWYPQIPAFLKKVQVQ